MIASALILVDRCDGDQIGQIGPAHSRRGSGGLEWAAGAGAAATGFLCGRRGNCFDAIEERLRVSEILCVKTLGKPTIGRREDVVCLGVTALVAAESGEAHRSAQFPELGLLLRGDAQGLAKEFLGGRGIF